MVTQVLFGEHYKILEERAKWVKIRLAYDKYECYIDRKQAFEVSKDVYDQIETGREWTSLTELATVCVDKNRGILVPLLMGSVLPNFDGQSCHWGEERFELQGSVTHSREQISRSRVIEHSLMYENAPYLWGGKTPFGIDCSGFTQMVYKLAGKKLPRDAYQQAEIGTTLSFVEEAEDGDLAFFDDEEGNIIHVGILMNENDIIHASGKVRIDKIDHQGIYNRDTRSYTHKLRLIKTIL